MDFNQIEKKIKKGFYESEDLVLRRVELQNREVLLCYFEGMIQAQQLDLGVVTPMVECREEFTPDIKGLNTILRTGVGLKAMESLVEALPEVGSGECMMCMSDSEEFFILSLRGYAIRAVTEPPTSAVLKGPREGFTEDLKTNMVLLRRRFRSTKLVFRTAKVGRYTDTGVCVAYLKGVAEDSLAERILKRIREIDIDGVIDSSYVAKFLEKRPYSIFRQNGTAEKPDIVAGKMLEGRVAVFVDGSPIALTLPFIFLEDFQDSSDYYKRAVRTTILRVMRLIAVFFAILLPAMVVALEMHQFQLLPVKLLITVMNSMSGIPFDPLLEMLLALLLFEVLGEASVRMPRYVGMAISIVGAIVLGETAVNAGILSSVTVLVTALSGIGLYAIPDEVGTFSVIRLALTALSGATGIFGIVLGSITVIAYLVSMEVYGAPYMAPLAPMIGPDLKDTFFKVDLKDMKKRPYSIPQRNKRRMSDDE